MKRIALAVAAVLALSAPALADDAADVYKAKCKGCHGDDGAAKTKTGMKEKIPDISAPAWQQKHTDEDIRKVISEGSSDNKKMKPFKEKLSPDQIAALVKYVRGLERK